MFIFSQIFTQSVQNKGNRSKAKEVMQIGQKLVRAKDVRIDSPSNTVFKDAYIEFISLTYLLNEEDDKFEDIILNKLINSFTNSNSYNDLGYYLDYLGRLYFKQERYKEAAEAFEKSKDAYKEALNIR